MAGAAGTLFPAALDFPERIEGRRLLIRPYEASDAPLVREAVEESRDWLKPWMPWWNSHQSIEESVAFCVRSRAEWMLRENMNLAIFDRETGRYLGGSGFHRGDWLVRRFEIGYWRRVSAGGRGVVTDTVKLLTHYAYEHMGANRVEIRCDARNVASRRVAERAGYVLEGTLRRSGLTDEGGLRDGLVFSLLREEYEALLPSWADSFPAP